VVYEKFLSVSGSLNIAKQAKVWPALHFSNDNVAISWWAYDKKAAGAVIVSTTLVPGGWRAGNSTDQR
jgi:hypothetical protein